jgi:hypothetical protein
VERRKTFLSFLRSHEPHVTQCLMPSALPSREDAVPATARGGSQRTDFVAIRRRGGSPVRARPMAPRPLLAGHVLGSSAPEAKVSSRTAARRAPCRGAFAWAATAPGPMTRPLALPGLRRRRPLRCARGPTGRPRRGAGLVVRRGCRRTSSGAEERKVAPLVLLRSAPARSQGPRVGAPIAPKSAPLASGGVADVRSARGIELFPKQPKIRRTGYGNLVWLPWWTGASEGGNRFYRALRRPTRGIRPTSSRPRRSGPAGRPVAATPPQRPNGG